MTANPITSSFMFAGKSGKMLISYFVNLYKDSLNVLAFVLQVAQPFRLCCFQRRSCCCLVLSCFGLFIVPSFAFLCCVCVAWLSVLGVLYLCLATVPVL